MERGLRVSWINEGMTGWMDADLAATPSVTKLGFWSLILKPASVPWGFIFIFSLSQHHLGPTPKLSRVRNCMPWKCLLECHLFWKKKNPSQTTFSTLPSQSCLPHPCQSCLHFFQGEFKNGKSRANGNLKKPSALERWPSSPGKVAYAGVICLPTLNRKVSGREPYVSWSTEHSEGTRQIVNNLGEEGAIGNTG